ncbi:hypothetical protein [Demequina lutea]|uniref:Uncharacterized protein n=1 Tax=Demequina lutea TaxID=431489 RepID=A0A7Y9Z783_9MICO|nr:hypothetical protein [Demequina lutea]NYI39891.1 hypothetical protein [Demequina lutea]
MSEPAWRTWIALGLAEVLFAVTYTACAWLAMALPATDTRDGWAALALFAMLLVVGVFAVLVGIPIGVHTVGRLTAKWVAGRSSLRASSAHLVMGLGMGAVVAAMMIHVSPMEPAVAVIAFVVPVGLVALGTNLLMPLAMRHRWIRITSWALAAVLWGLTLVFVASLVAGNL